MMEIHNKVDIHIFITQGLLSSHGKYTQYPIIRNGDQRPPVEFLKISKILDSHRFLFYHASLVTVS